MAAKTFYKSARNSSADKSMRKRNIRAIAARVIQKVSQEQRSLSTELPPALELVPFKDQALLQELCFGVCRWHTRLEIIRKSALNKPLRRQDRIANELILVGLYQLFETRIPEHAALYETVAATEELGIGQLKSIINGVLRNVLRQKSEWQQQFESDDALRFSHPQWIQEKLQHNWPDDYAAILTNNNDRPPMTLRVNRQQVSREAYLETLDEAGIAGEATPLSPWGIRLEKPVDVNKLPGFQDGMVSVQDEAAQLCTLLLDLHTGQRVLDACAAPGGKTCAMLEAEPDLNVTALDHDATRLTRVAQNLARLQVQADLVAADACQTDRWWNGQPFDRILLDAPCSATGVIRRHPDIKLLRKEEDIKQLAETQLNILQALWSTLAEGGRLVYATCSVFSQENSRIIERFLKQEPSAQLLGEAFTNVTKGWGIASETGVQLLPNQHGHDGFFYACLIKVS